jgi:Transmembrane domain of unknown function (DUF3566)
MNLRKPLMSTSTTSNPVTAPRPSANPAKNPAPPATVAKREPLRPAGVKAGGRANETSRQNEGKRTAKLERRYNQTIRRIDLWSVMKVAVCFYLCALLVMLVAGVILWFVADTVGMIDNVESFVGDLFDDTGFKFFPAEILRAATLLGLVFAALATVMTVLATGFYNLFSDLIGGIEITVAEES